jgi:ceramide glucosyltransferase
MFALPLLLHLFSASLFVLCLGALWFYGYTLYAAIDYLSHQDGTIDPDFQPPITILKPLCGLDHHLYHPPFDPELYARLATFCQQDYAKYQVIFAVQQATDPRIAVVQQLIQQFPERDIQLVIDDQAAEINEINSVGIHPVGIDSRIHLKVNRLTNAAALAKYELWVIADGDLRVGRDYLRQIVQPLRYPGVGVVICPYRSQATGWLATLEALGTATELHPGILTARKREGLSFAVGPTLAVRKTVLEKIGGFIPLAADVSGYGQVGQLATTVGYRVCLSHYIVEQQLGQGSLGNTFQRQLQWAQGLQISRSWGYWSNIFTYGTVVSLLLLLISGGSSLGWATVSITWLARLLTVQVISVAWLKDRPTQRYWWLLPIYDLLSFVVWCWGLLSHYLIEEQEQPARLPNCNLSATADAPDYVPVLEKI